MALSKLKYIPILRGRQQELIVLKSFDFGTSIYPCLEIIKELDRLPSKTNKKSKKSPKHPKKFEEVYLPLISKIQAQKVLVDIPIHLKDSRNMKPETIDFLRTVAGNRIARTKYINKLSSLSKKIIPVVSTYHGRTGEIGSIKLQESDLRKSFPNLAFRTFQNSFFQDIAQIETVVVKGDIVIMDWEDTDLDETDEGHREIIERLQTLNCTVAVHRNAIPKSLTNVGLIHGKVIDEITNNLLSKYESYSGSCFSDYCGIKKDGITKGGTISPGFIYYDAVENQYYGYKSDIKDLDQYEKVIIPSVIMSEASKRMKVGTINYLSELNGGWSIIQKISRKEESGKSPAKFKRIGMEHYLHCIKSKIEFKALE